MLEVKEGSWKGFQKWLLPTRTFNSDFTEGFLGGQGPAEQKDPRPAGRSHPTQEHHVQLLRAAGSSG